MKTKIIIASILGAAVTFSSAASAQEKVTVNGNIDLVNNYVWRGMDQNSGFSVQPTLAQLFHWWIVCHIIRLLVGRIAQSLWLLQARSC